VKNNQKILKHRNVLQGWQLNPIEKKSHKEVAEKQEHRGQVFILDKRVLYCSKEGGGDSPRLNKCRSGFNWVN
jgi:hypothetical protein